MKKHYIFALLLLMLACSMSYAQSPKAADMSIDSITVEEIPGKFSVDVTVRSGDNDSDTGGEAVELRIVLPFPSVFLSFSGDAQDCTAYKSSLALSDAYIVCNIGDMDFNSTKSVHISTTRNSAYNLKTFSAFVTSKMPDPHPENNFAFGEPCK